VQYERAIRRQWRYPAPRTSVRQLREQEPTAREIKANEAFRRGRQSAPPLQPPQGVSIAVDTNVKVEFFRNSSGSLAKFAAIRRASSFVGGQPICARKGRTRRGELRRACTMLYVQPEF